MYDIYLITCLINNKKYIGQTQQLTVDGKPWGYKKRFQAHGYKNSRSVLLRNAILKYKIENFSCELLGTSDEKMVDILESFFIKLYNTKHPNGYNLESGGNKLKKLSDRTRKLMSESRMGHPNYMTEEGKKKISRSLELYHNKNPKPKFDHNNNQLPKYISSVKENGIIVGYCINNISTKFRKKITSRNLSLDEKLDKILKYIN